ncbi:DnaJ domain-containing protein [bacterium]|jgi:hypothetical protein|nr:DnaJ domain-containing protein [bacterium]
MYNNTAIYIFNRLVRLAILFFILYLIFTNFGTFLMIIGVIFFVIAFLIYNFKKKMQANSFKFKFDSSNFQNGYNGQNFNFNDFKNFNQSDFQGFANAPRFDEVTKAKEFFGFTHSPTKEEIKKRYKELARKYHPDINDGDDVKMKELNHFRDVLIKTVE